MKLYTERHGIRAPLEKTYSVNRDMYSLLDVYKRQLINHGMVSSALIFTSFKRLTISFKTTLFHSFVPLMNRGFFAEDLISKPSSSIIVYAHKKAYMELM